MKTAVLIAAAGTALAASAVSAAPVYVNFAATDTTNTPANFNLASIGGTYENLTDLDGNATAIDLALSAEPNSYTTGGPGAGALSGDLAAFGAAASTAIYGDDAAGRGTLTITFSDLDPSATYNFDLASARNNVTGVRTALFTFAGSNSGTAVVNATNNTSTIGEVNGISPTAGGDIVLTVVKDTTNDNGSGFFYVNGLSIDAVGATVPEPTMAGLAAVGGLTLLRRRRA